MTQKVFDRMNRIFRIYPSNIILFNPAILSQICYTTAEKYMALTHGSRRVRRVVGNRAITYTSASLARSKRLNFDSLVVF